MCAADPTPETYLGYDRAQNFGGKERATHDTLGDYRFPAFLPENQWALDGRWKVAAQKIVAGEKNAALRLNFKARRSAFRWSPNTAGGKPVHATLNLNGETVGGNEGKDAPAGMLSVGTRCMN